MKQDNLLKGFDNNTVTRIRLFFSSNKNTFYKVINKMVQSCKILYIMLFNFFLNGNHKWPTLFVKVVKVEMKKNCYWNCWFPNQQIKLHPTSWKYPLINYLDLALSLRIFNAYFCPSDFALTSTTLKGVLISECILISIR